MKYCSKCGNELKESQKFCVKCGTEILEGIAETSAPLPAKQQVESPEQESTHSKRGGKLPVFIAVGAIIVILIAVVFKVTYKPQEFQKVEEPQITESPKPESTPSAEPIVTQKTGELAITGIDISGYPLINVDMTARNMETLALGNVTVYDGEAVASVKYIQQVEAGDSGDRYKIQVEVVEPLEDSTVRAIKIATGNIESAIEYEVSYAREDVSITINQVDDTNFPEISVYFSMHDAYGEYIMTDNAQLFNLLDANGVVSAKEVITSLKTTRESSSVNVALVLDRSGSMEIDNNFYAAQEMAVYFLDLLDYAKGDQAAIISFDDNVYLNHLFSGDRDELKGAVWSMYTDGVTAVYDALLVSLLEIAGQGSARCIVALTDGMDNSSTVSLYTVVDKAQELGVPIYVIGLGYEDFSGVREIAYGSGGYFTNVYTISDVKGIYEDLMEEQQNQMVVTYTLSDANSGGDHYDIALQFKNRDYIGMASQGFQYQGVVNPNRSEDYLNTNIENMSDVERAIYYYEHNFVQAVNSYNFDELSGYLDPDGSLYGQQKALLDNYKKRLVKERLLYYRINNIQPLSDGSYMAVVNEQFYIQIGDDQASYKEFENTYIIRNTTDGYKVSELTELNTLTDRNVNIYLN